MPDIAATTPANRAAEPADWATDLAITIIAEVQRYPFRDSLDLLAARLRVVEQQGAVKAAHEAHAVVVDAMAGRARLQAEHQADHEDAAAADEWATS